MDLRSAFEVAAGTIVGREHHETGRNNQDAFAVGGTEDAIVAVVCDGCSSSPHSEIGATLGAHMVLKAVLTASTLSAATRSPGVLDDRLWNGVWYETLGWLRGIRDRIPFPWHDRFAEECLLFTIVGVLITERETTIFARGDGIAVVNGEPYRFGPFPGNAPPYLAHELSIPETRSDRQTFTLHRFPTETITSVLIGTDGVINLKQKANVPMPGSTELVGPISQFWTDDRYFRNPDMVRRKLTLLHRTVLRPDWDAQRLDVSRGLLPDDTTLVAIRRRKEEGDDRGTRGGETHSP